MEDSTHILNMDSRGGDEGRLFPSAVSEPSKGFKSEKSTGRTVRMTHYDTHCQQMTPEKISAVYKPDEATDARWPHREKAAESA